VAIRRARNLAAESEKDVEKEVENRSQALLTKFLKLPAQERLEGLDNVALTAGDRATLRQSFVGALNRRQPVKWSANGSGRFARLWGRSSHLVPIVVRLVIALLFVGVPSWTAWRNTARSVTVATPGVIEWRGPGQTKTPSTVREGSILIVVHRHWSGYFAREWASPIGYIYAPVNMDEGH
jgi:hypothetical protein